MGIKNLTSLFKKNTLLVIILTIAGFITYKDCLKNPLFWDDEATIINNLFIRDFGYIKEIFTSGYHYGWGEKTNLYRPLATLSLAIEYHFFKLNPKVYHLTNIILHIINSLILFFLSQEFFSLKKISFFISLLYLIHPQATEVVNYASHRPELLMCLFFLLSFYTYIKFTKTNKKLFLFNSLLFYILSILSKEMGIILVLFLFFYNMFILKKASNKQLFFFVGIALLYIGLRATCLNFLGVSLLKGPQFEPYSENLVERLLIFSKIFFIYLKIFFWPVGLHMERDIPYLKTPHDLWAIIACLSIISIITISILKRRQYPQEFWEISWLFLGLLPVSGVIPINTAIAEHYLYLPSIGFFMFIVNLIFKGYKKISKNWFKYIFRILILIIFIGLSCLTVKRNKEWNDPLTLYQSTIKYAKYSFRAHNNLGVEYFRKKNFKKAEYYFKKALKINPSYAPALNNIGVIALRKGKVKEAISYYKKSKEEDPNYLLAYKNLAGLYIRLGLKKEAKKELENILQRFPYDQEAKRLLKIINK
ncbi:MAG: tetratricopeptide repeat protein [Candidatus Omnitrophica bacterium]|nr:tetratricopeptide repeat protein [Candidatus Omnitrophota bacterium]